VLQYEILTRFVLVVPTYCLQQEVPCISPLILGPPRWDLACCGTLFDFLQRRPSECSSVLGFLPFILICLSVIYCNLTHLVKAFFPTQVVPGRPPDQPPKVSLVHLLLLPLISTTVEPRFLRELA